jgi:crossover junction endodeoxyribonuclease RusA
VIPFEFIVDCPPVSFQTKNRGRYRNWQMEIQREANRYWVTGDPPCHEQLKMIVTYFYEDVLPDIDSDNILKPFQDALIGLVYDDDNQISDTRCRRKNIEGSYKIDNLSAVLAEGISRGKEFFHVKIELDSDSEVL